jgi:hypothetical protein
MSVASCIFILTFRLFRVTAKRLPYSLLMGQPSQLEISSGGDSGQWMGCISSGGDSGQWMGCISSGGASGQWMGCISSGGDSGQRKGCISSHVHTNRLLVWDTLRVCRYLDFMTVDEAVTRLTNNFKRGRDKS